MKNPYHYLTYSGVLPFVAAATLIAFDVSSLPVLGDISELLCAYTLAIISFVAGSYWGVYLQSKNHHTHWLAIVSNVIVVFAWISFIMLPLKALLFIFIVIFLVLLGLDRVLLKNESITVDYFRTRLFASMIAIVALAIAGIFA